MKIAIVTGASSGLGNEFVKQIAKKYKVIDEIWIVARRKEKLIQLENEIPTRVRIFPIDLSVDSDIRILADQLLKQKPDVKLLINCAGYGKTGDFELGSYEEEIGMITTNCKALTAVTYLVLPYMKARSRILNIASAAAFLPQPQFAVYAASKSFVFSFTRALRYEVASRKIYVTAVCPGPVETDFFQIADPDGQTSWYKKFFLVKPAKVVKKALHDSSLNDEISIYGLPMKIIYFLTKVIPHRFLLKILYGNRME